MPDQEDAAATQTSETPDAAESEAKENSGPNPMLSLGGIQGFVRGGTSTSANDKELEKQFWDAEKRRDEAMEERRLANIPIDAGGAKLYTHKLTDTPDVPKAYIFLKYLTPQGEDTGERCLADLIIGAGDDPLELMLVLVCLKCAKLGIRHHDQMQLQIRQKNRNFQFVPAVGSQRFMFEGQVYYSAGMVMDSEKFTCPVCGWSAHIDKNRVWPEAL
jgi:hypothetical protein